MRVSGVNALIEETLSTHAPGWPISSGVITLLGSHVPRMFRSNSFWMSSAPTSKNVFSPGSAI